MAISAIVPAAIAAGGSIFGSMMASGGNKRAVKEANKGNKELAEYQYAKNLDMWHLTNAYNSPTSQMERLKAAGLNPNMVYGEGGATKAAVGAPNYEAPTLQSYTGTDYGVRGGVNAGLQAYQAQQQLRNMETQNDVNKQQITNMQSQKDYVDQQTISSAQSAAESAMRTARTKFDLDLATELKNNTLQVAQANLSRVNANIDSVKAATELTRKNIDFQDLRRELTQSQIGQLQAATHRLYQETDFARFEQDLKKLGVYPNDSLFSRILARVLSDTSGTSTGSRIVDSIGRQEDGTFGYRNGKSFGRRLLNFLTLQK